MQKPPSPEMNPATQSGFKGFIKVIIGLTTATILGKASNKDADNPQFILDLIATSRCSPSSVK